jgi:hypothetical protein
MANEKRAGNSDQIPIPPLAASVSRRGFLTGAGAASLAAAAVPLAATRAARGAGPATPDGTPEQIHLTWGEDPSRVVIVSWASAAQAINPRVHFGGDCSFGKTVPAVQRTYAAGLNGQTVFTYHARLGDLRPDSPHHYAVTADNDSHGADPFKASFRTAPKHHAPSRWTSYGDLATPVTAWVLSYPQSQYAVEAVERFQPPSCPKNRTGEKCAMPGACRHARVSFTTDLGA